MMNLVSWNPFREMENALAQLGWPCVPSPALTQATRTWWPATDIQETARAYVIQTELPGLSKDAIKVRLEDHVLQIEGERTEAQSQKDANTYHSMERVHGKFLRRFTLPDDIIVAQIQAAYKDGVLKIDLPKKEDPNPTKAIKIRVS